MQGSIAADVCVVGAGIAGLATAYHLASEGRRVVVIDREDVGSGETQRTSAHLASALDDRYFEIERLHGERGAQLAAESHHRAIRRIEEIVQAEQIRCGFEWVDGYLFNPPGDPPDILENELDAALRAGLEVEFVPRTPLPALDTGRALRFANQAQFHPMKFLRGLARAVEKRGAVIYPGSPLTEFEAGPPCVVKTEAGSVTAASVVVATNTPVIDWVAMHTKQAAYRTYVIALPVPHGSVTKALYWDTPDPYHYVRLEERGDDDLLIVGGEDHKTGQEDETEVRFERLRQWTLERFPQAGAIEYHWSGQVMEPVDSLAFIGRNPGQDNVYIVTGDSGNGLTHGMVAGLLLTDLIQGRPNDWETLYDPSRISLRTAGEFVSENLNAAAQLIDYVTPGDVPEEAAIPKGSGAVLRDGLKKIAVYRDDGGQLHHCSAVCPHLGCIVHWNPTESTWDCPCHGSRFDPRGQVLNGPAVSPLAPVTHR